MRRKRGYYSLTNDCPCGDTIRAECDDLARLLEIAELFKSQHEGCRA